MITVVNSVPGMHRAGVAHPAVQSYADIHFTTEQLLVLVREPAFTVLRGVVVTEGELLAIKAKADAEATKAANGAAATGKKA